jgi:hypothetical protein
MYQIQLLRQVAYDVLSPRFQLRTEDRAMFEERIKDDDLSVDGELAQILSTQIDNVVDVVSVWLIKLGSDMVAKRKEEFDEYNQNPDNGA